MHLAIDALPINNFSGRAVLRGHLRNLANAGRGRHQFTIFHHAANNDLREELGEHVRFHCCPVGSGWIGRIAWQSFQFDRILRSIRADAVLSTSGALIPNIGIPQWVFAQNPWCFFSNFHRGSERLKAWLQRRGYREAQRKAQAIFYLSDYMRRLYGKNAKGAVAAGATIYVGVDQDYFRLAQQTPPPAYEERPCEVLTVSVMTPHKSIEDIIAAFAILRARGVDASLRLVGPWATPVYRKRIESMIRLRGLDNCISIEGHLSRLELACAYKRARVFCLLSRCESFGIPAVEAQVFGTPTVVADVCAPPEIAGPGGKIVAEGDSVAAAAALTQLLTNEDAWKTASRDAFANAQRFHWDNLSRPIVDMMNGWQP
ncbi:MAG: glycosyltransferase [Xanthomonadales bacterium PRO6]|nr:D-inositol-3-phosphate glycosyltransferase [Xanthomonadales bacterium]MCE7930746.1 glycosyltransferase [Xanthomonadales bacterium PRO6]